MVIADTALILRALIEERVLCVTSEYGALPARRLAPGAGSVLAVRNNASKGVRGAVAGAAQLGQVIASSVEIADSRAAPSGARSRPRRPASGTALIITLCKGVHTFAMPSPSTSSSSTAPARSEDQCGMIGPSGSRSRDRLDGIECEQQRAPPSSRWRSATTCYLARHRQRFPPVRRGAWRPVADRSWRNFRRWGCRSSAPAPGPAAATSPPVHDPHVDKPLPRRLVDPLLDHRVSQRAERREDRSPARSKLHSWRDSQSHIPNSRGN